MTGTACARSSPSRSRTRWRLIEQTFRNVILCQTQARTNRTKKRDCGVMRGHSLRICDPVCRGLSVSPLPRSVLLSLAFALAFAASAYVWWQFYAELAGGRRYVAVAVLMGGAEPVWSAAVAHRTSLSRAASRICAAGVIMRRHGCLPAAVALRLAGNAGSTAGDGRRATCCGSGCIVAGFAVAGCAGSSRSPRCGVLGVADCWDALDVDPRWRIGEPGYLVADADEPVA